MQTLSIYRVGQIAVGLAFAWSSSLSHAALFEDDEARKAILDLRQRVETVRQAADASEKRQTSEASKILEENSQLRRSMLDIQGQIEAAKQDLAKLRGQNEQLARDLADLQRRQKDLLMGVEDRFKKFEPVKVTVDGKEFTAEPAEKRDFEAALAVFRKGDFPAAQSLLFDFLKRNPGSGYAPSAFFWLGNAQYATRDYKEAIANFKAVVSQASDHLKAPEALLSVANCYAELKDNRSARRTLDELIKVYPQSDAAVAGKERLSRLK
ncbi:MAG: tol-pal system protein YbgF [Betaproteobacteria bacterium]|nr:tol-pal system protein YbgF [Betaproteobacteria bacterium]MBP6644706.1 tol-pal system protein YbgF [Burkholderiaceae bacterium]